MTSILLSEEQLLCSICLQIFTHPATLPCGHNFCKDCVTTYWAETKQRSGFFCPVCMKRFDRQPDVLVNTLLSEFASQLKKTPAEVGSTIGSEGNRPRDAATCPEVLCDVCTGPTVQAVKSCSVGLASRCETHLEPRQKVPETRKLVDPAEKPVKRTCEKHGKALEIFCKSDRACICIKCLQTDHWAHVTVPLESACEALKTQLAEKKAEVQRMIGERRQDIDQIEGSVDENNTVVELGIADAAEIFTALVSSVQRSQAEAVGLMKSKKRAAAQKAQELMAKAQQDIAALQVRGAELEELLRTEDNLGLLQRFPSVSTAPKACDWPREAIEVDVVGIIQGAMDQMRRAVDEKVEKLDELKLKRIRQRYMTDVTLDPDTMHPELRLSSDRKSVRLTNQNMMLPNNPERFSSVWCVLGKEGFSAGKFYYEVQVAGNTKWSVGAARGSISRKGDIPQHNYWLLRLIKGKYSARAENITTLRLKMTPQRIGVFLDYEGEQVCFYDAETAALLYSFTGCNFNEKVWPLLCCYCGNAPLTINPVYYK